MITVQVIITLLGGGTLGVVATSIIQWARFRKKDTSDKVRIDAETEKLRAEAGEIKARAEVTVADAALKLAEKISEECEGTRRELERTQVELGKTITKLNETTAELRTLQRDLELERKRSAENSAEIDRLRGELMRLQGGQ